MLKLPGISKEAVIGINSCDGDKIQRAFGEISNYVGTNMDGEVAHYIQCDLDTRENYPFEDKIPPDPSISVMINTESVKETKEIKASAWDLMTLQVKGKGHTITV